MKNCELCRRVARTHCESDQASLCWTCDYRVHAANFLVARHSRTLLCHICQSPTPWSATGTKLGPTVSFCENCAARRNCDGNNEGKAGYGDTDVEIESDGGSDEGAETSSSSSEVVVVDDEDNQVVPWSPTTPPPAASSSSNSDGESYSSSASSAPRHRRKRTHQNASDLRLNANRNDSSSSRGNIGMPPPTVAVTVSPACEKNLKKRRLPDSSRVGFLSPNSGGATTADSVKRMYSTGSSAAVAECLSVDRDFAECSQP